MKRSLRFLALIPLVIACGQAETETVVATEATAQQNQAKTMKTFHDFTVTDINGNPYSLAQLKGKRVLVVNTASECGFTPQYAQLQELYQEYGGDSFQIVGFPANDFGAQEPGNNQEIAAFCSKNYGVTFPMMAKITVKGDNTHELYRWLTTKSENGVADSEVEWNFQKYLINEQGRLVKHYESAVTPLDEEIVRFASGS